MVATLLLGWSVGHGSTTLDSWFARGATAFVGSQPRWLLIFTSEWLVLTVALASVAVALLRRQWVLAGAVVLCPIIVTVATAALKHFFDRHNGAYLEYPSGHTALLVAVLGMMVLVATARPWAVAAAVVLSALGIVGLVACGYHFFTDTVGAATLATAAVCGTARLTSAR